MYASKAYNVFMPTEQVKPRVKEQRIAARVTEAHKALFEQAALLKGLSLTDFMVSAAYEAAVKVLADSQIILELGPADSRLFFAHLLKPREPAEVPALQEAIRRYQERGDAI